MACEINIPVHLAFCIQILQTNFGQSASVLLTDSNPVIVKQSSSQTWFCWPSDNPVRKQLVTKKIESELTLTCSVHVPVAIDVECIQNSHWQQKQVWYKAAGAQSCKGIRKQISRFCNLIGSCLQKGNCESQNTGTRNGSNVVSYRKLQWNLSITALRNCGHLRCTDGWLGSRMVGHRNVYLLDLRIRDTSLFCNTDVYSAPKWVLTILIELHTTDIRPCPSLVSSTNNAEMPHYLYCKRRWLCWRTGNEASHAPHHCSIHMRRIWLVKQLLGWMSRSTIVCSGFSCLQRHLGTRKWWNAGIKVKKRELYTSLAGSTMMLINNLAEAHLAAAIERLHYKIFQKLIWIVMLAGSQFLKMHNTITEIVVFHYCTLFYSCWVCDILE